MAEGTRPRLGPEPTCPPPDPNPSKPRIAYWGPAVRKLGIDVE
jgi:hypothetical protein